MNPRIREKCSCGASLEIAVFSNSALDRWDWRMDQVREWRSSHIHESPSAPEAEDSPNPPWESNGSLVEKAWPEPDVHRPLIGFSPNGL